MPTTRQQIGKTTTQGAGSLHSLARLLARQAASEALAAAVDAAATSTAFSSPLSSIEEHGDAPTDD